MFPSDLHFIPLILSSSIYFQVFINLGIEGKLGWNEDSKETNEFYKKWSKIYEFYKTKIRRLKSKLKEAEGKTTPDVAKIEKLKEQIKNQENQLQVPFICPKIFPNILWQFQHKRPRAGRTET